MLAAALSSQHRFQPLVGARRLAYAAATGQELSAQYAPIRCIVVDDQQTLVPQAHRRERLGVRWRFGDCKRQREVKSRALIGFAGNANGPAHELHQSLGYRKTEARASILTCRRGVRLREGLEQPGNHLL